MRVNDALVELNSTKRERAVRGLPQKYYITCPHTCPQPLVPKTDRLSLMSHPERSKKQSVILERSEES